MNVLWLSEIFPYPPNNGMKVWMMNFLRPLAQWHDITLITATETGEPPENVAFVQQFCREVQVVHCPLEDAQPRPDEQSLPASAKQFSFPALHQAVRDAMLRTSFDVVVVEMLRMAHYLPKNFDGLTVFNEHDVESLRYRSTIRMKKGLRRKLWCYQEYRRLRRYETEMVAKFDLCLCVAEHDVAILKRWAPSASVHYMPDPIDTEECEPFLNAPKDEKLISFCGALNYHPNVDALLYFYRDVYPLIKQQAPDVKLLVVGRKPTEEVMSLCDDPSVTGAWDQKDIKPFLARSAVSVAPVRLGGGTKVKILTAMSLGLPVVTTPHGLEGLHAEVGANLLVGRNAREFAQQVVRLLQDRQLRQSIAESGLRRLRAHYGMDVVSRNLHELLTAALERKRQREKVGVMEKTPMLQQLK
jgi:glycosyltransferase involved in cell wall biosynthesis